MNRKRAQSDSGRHRGQRGFSLVELMVAMVLSLFLVGGVILMYTSGKAAINDGQRLSRLQEDMRFAVEFMVRDIRQGGYCVTRCALVGADDDNFAQIFSGGTRSTSGDELHILYEIPEDPARDCRGVNPPSTIDANVALNRYTFSESSLRCKDQALVDGVSNLQFAEIRDGEGNLVGVEVTLGFDPGGEFGTRQMSYVVAFRNRILAPLWD